MSRVFVSGLLALVLTSPALAMEPEPIEAPVVATFAAAGLPVLDALATGSVPEEIEALAVGALPPAPRRAVIVTETYGTITLDHRAHLARRTTCKTCHGPGVVAKFGRLPPREAHDRCLTCHRAEPKAPTACRDCHVKKAPEPELDAATLARQTAATKAEEERKAKLASEQARAKEDQARVDALLAAAAAAAATEEEPAPTFVQVITGGYSGFSHAGQPATSGPTLAMSLRLGTGFGLVALERETAAGHGRTTGLLGGGGVWRLYRGFQVYTAGVVGFDAAEAPVGAVPVVGVRTGLEYLWNRIAFGVGGTGLTLLSARGAEKPGNLTFAYGGTVGYVLGGR